MRLSSNIPKVVRYAPGKPGALAALTVGAEYDVIAANADTDGGRFGTLTLKNNLGEEVNVPAKYFDLVEVEDTVPAPEQPAAAEAPQAETAAPAPEAPPVAPTEGA